MGEQQQDGPAEPGATAYGDPGHLDRDRTEQVLRLALDLAREGRTAALVGLVEHGVPVDLADLSGNTLLMLAAYHGHVGTVTTLLDLGADPDRLNARGQSPLAGAVFKGEDAVVAALRAAGADLDAGSPTARESAALFGRPELVD